MRDYYPEPGSEEAVGEGCTCERNQTNQNWRKVNPKCPVHGGVDFMMWNAKDGGKSWKKRGA